MIDEIPRKIFQNLAKTKKEKFIMLDPQGFLRNWNKETLLISYKEKLDLDFKGITAIKTDEEELSESNKRNYIDRRYEIIKEKILSGICYFNWL